jgi:hypothetical protein
VLVLVSVRQVTKALLALLGCRSGTQACWHPYAVLTLGVRWLWSGSQETCSCIPLLFRMDVSKIVLNRGLRQAVLAAAAAQGLSMSEIAVRCGRVKHDSKGKESGETSWLARRLGIAPEHLRRATGSGPEPAWNGRDALTRVTEHATSAVRSATKSTGLAVVSLRRLARRRRSCFAFPFWVLNGVDMETRPQSLFPALHPPQPPV